MKRRIICLLIILSMMLGGCSWMDGNYVSVTPHHKQLTGNQTGTLSAANYSQLRKILSDLTEAGTENAVIYVGEYDQTQVQQNMEDAVHYICNILPLGTYAIDQVDYEIGTSGSQPAISVTISYLHGRSELRKIRHVDNMESAKSIIENVLRNCEAGVVLHIQEYSDLDWEQLVADYAAENPDVVMELPAVAVGLYPEQGPSRVAELKFTYQTSRDTLRSMQTQVRRVFASASLYINQSDAETQKYAQLFNFLMERFDYKIETSITPSYSLLSHGVGDGRAFANVYAAMCRSAGLDCRTVTGTKNGEAWYWNLICDEGRFYHVDLLACSETGELVRLTDEEMDGYVWDYSAYPATDTLADPTTPTE